MQVTRDGLIRMRPSPGLLVSWAQATWSAEKLAAGLGELAITERALRDGTTLTGTLPRALLLVENVGCYIDLPVPDGWLVAHLPGWNSATVRLLLAQLPAVLEHGFGLILSELQRSMTWEILRQARHATLAGSTAQYPSPLPCSVDSARSIS